MFYDHTSTCFGGGTPAPCNYGAIAPCAISAQYGIGLAFASDVPSGPSSWAYHVYINYGTGVNPAASVASITTGNIAGTGTYYPTLERLSPTSGRLSVYSNAARTVHIPGSPVTFSIPAGIAGLNTLQTGVQEMGYTPRALTGSIDNICISSQKYNAVTTVEKGADAPAIYPNPARDAIYIRSSVAVEAGLYNGLASWCSGGTSKAAGRYQSVNCPPVFTSCATCRRAQRSGVSPNCSEPAGAQ